MISFASEVHRDEIFLKTFKYRPIMYQKKTIDQIKTTENKN
jgi:hypothetical protein